jgi:carboxymethylenebutenolidase
MNETQISRPDGKLFRAYVAKPQDGESKSGVVVIHEMWGLDDTIRRVADRFSEAGYHAIVPDLFEGRLPKGMSEGFAAMGQLDMADAINQNIRSAVDWLVGQGLSTAVAGFCMGGALAISAGVQIPKLKAAVCFYGIPDNVDPAALKIPLISHFARNDNWCTPGKVDVLEERLKAGKVPYELYRYDEGHAFMNTAGPTYSEQADRVAWGRTLEFLGRNLGRA